MSCAVEMDLTAYLDGELPTARRHEMQSHLKECRSCQATSELLEKTLSKLASLPALESSPGMRSALLRQIAQPRSSVGERLRQRWRPGWVLPSAGLAVAALAAVLLVGRAPRDGRERELGANLEMVEDYEVLGLTSMEDLEIVQHLDELDGRP